MTHTYFSVLKPEKSKIKVLADLLSGGLQLPGLQLAILSLCRLKVENRVFHCRFYKGINPTCMT